MPYTLKVVCLRSTQHERLPIPCCPVRNFGSFPATRAQDYSSFKFFDRSCFLRGFMSAGSSFMPPALAPPSAEIVLFPAPCPYMVSTPPRYDQPAAFTRHRSFRPACLLQVVATFAAIVAVVFLVSECLVWRIQVPATSKLVGRRLASGEGDGDDEGLTEENICKALEEAEKEGDAASSVETPHVTRSVASRGGRRPRHSRRRGPRGKTLATLRILEKFVRDEKQTDSGDFEEPVSRGSPLKASSGASSSTPEDDDGSEEDWKGPGKPDHLLEMFMERARKGAAATRRQEAVSAASSDAPIIPSAASADAQHLRSLPPRKRPRGGSFEGELADALQKSMHPESSTEQQKTLAKRAILGKGPFIAAEVVEGHSSGGPSMIHRPSEFLEGETAGLSSGTLDDEVDAEQFLDAYLFELLDAEAPDLLADWILEPSQGIPLELFRESFEEEADAESRAPFGSSERQDTMLMMDSSAPLESSDAAGSSRQGTGGSSSSNFATTDKPSSSWSIASQMPLNHRLEAYQRGQDRSDIRPGAEQTIWLMRQIFSPPLGVNGFQGAEWNGWREADRDFLKSRQASG
ncbi:hypothetical protein Emag_007068 [Eimeria magna]